MRARIRSDAARRVRARQPIGLTGAEAHVRRLIARYLPELVYGANDGVVTTFAIVAGVAGANLSPQVILILGFANLLADGVSMGASNFLSERSRPEGGRDFRQALRRGGATFAGFVGAGIVPLLAYLLPIFPAHRLAFAAGLAACVLLVVGAGRAFFTDRRPLQAGAEMLAIGACAGAVAYAAGLLGARLVGPAGG